MDFSSKLVLNAVFVAAGLCSACYCRNTWLCSSSSGSIVAAADTRLRGGALFYMMAHCAFWWHSVLRGGTLCYVVALCVSWWHFVFRGGTLCYVVAELGKIMKLNTCWRHVVQLYHVEWGRNNEEMIWVIVMCQAMCDGYSAGDGITEEECSVFEVFTGESKNSLYILFNSKFNIFQFIVGAWN